MLIWNLPLIEARAASLGIKNPRQLAAKAKFTYPVAWKILQGGPVGRVDWRTLEGLADALGVKWYEVLQRVE